MANCFVVSHKTPRCALSLPSRITNKSLEKLQDCFFKTETKTKCSRPRPTFDDPRPRSRPSFLIVLEAPRDQDPVVSRTTSLIKCTKFGQLILRKIIKIVASSAGGAWSAPPDPLAGFKEPDSKGGGERNERRGKLKGNGREGKGGEGVPLALILQF